MSAEEGPGSHHPGPQTGRVTVTLRLEQSPWMWQEGEPSFGNFCSTEPRHRGERQATTNQLGGTGVFKHPEEIDPSLC